jgi:ABC-type branched-subunit amino acid transport system substrate-binding protein
MISVLNRQQLLSGNKSFLFIIVFVLSSCGLLKGTTVNKDEEDKVVEKKEVKKEIVIKKEEKLEPTDGNQPNATRTVWFQGEQYEVALSKEKEFKIALVLPFNVDKSNTSEIKLGDIMFDYYHGWVQAFLELEKYGLKAKLYIYDSQNDSAVLAKLLSSYDLKQMDVIVGPISDKYMKMVAAFGEKNNIAVFSPFTPLDKLASNGQDFYNFSIDHKSKAKQIVAYIKKAHNNDKILIVRDGKKYDKEFIPYLMEELTNQNIAYTNVFFSNVNNWSALLNANNHLVYIPTTEKNVVSVSLGNIFATKKQGEVLGEYKWVEFVNNDYKFWSTLNVHLLATTYIDYNDTLSFEFRDNYRLANKIDPTEYAYTGYSQGRLVGEALSAFGVNFTSFINKRNLIYNGTCFEFDMNEGLNKNKHLWVLKFENGRLVPKKY